MHCSVKSVDATRNAQCLSSCSVKSVDATRNVYPTRNVYLPFAVNTDIGLHVSGNCYAVPGWVLVSTYGAENPPAGQAHSWMDTLLFMLELQDNPRIIKLARTQAYTARDPDAIEKNYFAEAFASINGDGSRIVFGSNWGRYLPQDYTDAYEVRLAPGWDQEGGAGPQTIRDLLSYENNGVRLDLTIAQKQF